MKRKKFILDWDGTCVTDSWPTMGTWMKGAPEALRLILTFADLEIDSCRLNPYEHGQDGVTLRPAHFRQQDIMAVRAMLDAEGLHAITIHTTLGKPAADGYIDNKGIHYNGRPGAWKALTLRLATACGVSLTEDSGSESPSHH